MRAGLPPRRQRESSFFFCRRRPLFFFAALSSAAAARFAFWSFSVTAFSHPPPREPSCVGPSP